MFDCVIGAGVGLYCACMLGSFRFRTVRCSFPCVPGYELARQYLLVPTYVDRIRIRFRGRWGLASRVCKIRVTSHGHKHLDNGIRQHKC
jgi:hypothetical protein